jgi:hypothetical protein
MPACETITKWLHAVVATLAILSQNAFGVWFAKLDIKQYAIVGPAFLAIAGILLVDGLTTRALNRMRWLRRLLAGRDDIEGDWVNVVIDTSKPDKVIAVEYMRIYYANGQYVAAGDQWTTDGKWIQGFASEGSNYTGRAMEFYYKTGIHRVGGYGVLIFSPPATIPTDFICRYVDEEIMTPHVTRGVRLSNTLKTVPLEEKRLAAIKFGEEFGNSGLLELDRALRQTILPTSPKSQP